MTVNKKIFLKTDRNGLLQKKLPQYRKNALPGEYCKEYRIRYSVDTIEKYSRDRSSKRRPTEILY